MSFKFLKEKVSSRLGLLCHNPGSASKHQKQRARDTVSENLQNDHSYANNLFWTSFYQEVEKKFCC